MRRPWRASTDLIRRADAVLDSVGLSGKRDALASALSHGDQRKLEVAMMMALEPKIYMFDEPTAGMSVDEVPVVLDLIARLKADATKTILLVEHKMDVVRSLADRIIVLTNGQLAADGDPATVIASPIVQEAYLGDRAGEGGMSAGADARRRAHPHRPLSHPAGRRLRRAGGQDDDAARPQRRRQDDGAAHHHGAVARLEGAHRARRDAARRASRRATSRGSASATRPRRWRCSPTSRSRRT